MVALHAVPGEDSGRADGEADVDERPEDWLPLQQAACELGVSESTLRRMIRLGRVRSRHLGDGSRSSQLVFLPNSRHAGSRVAGAMPANVIDLASRRKDEPLTNGTAQSDVRADDVRRLETQVEHLSEALSRALRLKQKALPEGIGQPDGNASDPYARYRWLVRRRRWWPFA